MPIDFTIDARQGVQNLASSFLSGGATAATGSLMGQAAVRVEDPMSVLSDAAEELGFAVDTTKDKSLADRKERERASRGMEDRVRLYEDLMRRAGKSGKIDELVQSLRSRARQGTERRERGVAEEAESLFPDPTDAYVALAAIVADLESDPDGGDPRLLDECRAALRDMEERRGPAIRAGMAGALAAGGYEDLGDADGMRDLYRDTVTDFGTVEDVFAFVHERFGDEGFDRAVDFLFAALSADIASDVPSMETVHLEEVHANLGQVRLFQTAYLGCADVLDRWRTVHGVECPLTPMAMLDDLVRLRTMRFVGAVQIDAVAAKAAPPDPEKEVLFLQEMLRMVRGFPSRLFDDDAGRTRVLDAVQEAVDGAVEREDAWLAGMEEE